MQIIISRTKEKFSGGSEGWGSFLSLLWLWVLAVAWVQFLSLSRELLHAVGVAKKKKKRHYYKPPDIKNNKMNIIKIFTLINLNNFDGLILNFWLGYCSEVLKMLIVWGTLDEGNMGSHCTVSYIQ